jgi:hypothetical protein
MRDKQNQAGPTADGAECASQECASNVAGQQPTRPKSTGTPFLPAQDALRSVLRRSWLGKSELMYAGPGRPI